MKLRSTIACGVLALALAGCSGESDEPETAPSSAAASTSPSQEPSPTFDPTKETAKQFIRRWIRIRNAMLNSGDTAKFRSVTSARCGDCQELIKERERVRSAGGWVKTEGWSATSIAHDGGSQWGVVIREAPFRWVESDGGQVMTSEWEEWNLKFHIVRDEQSGWVLADMTRVAS